VRDDVSTCVVYVHNFIGDSLDNNFIIFLLQTNVINLLIKLDYVEVKNTGFE